MAKQNRDEQVAMAVTLKPSQVYKAMEISKSCNDPMMIWGSPGIGKSEMIKAFADEHFPLLKDNVEKLAAMKVKAADPEDNSVTTADVTRFEASLLDQDTNFIDIRLSQVEPTDLRGIPIPVKRFTDAKTGNLVYQYQMVEGGEYVEETSVEWAPPSVLKQHRDWKGVILFDEINSAMPIVQAASYQLILDGKIGELTLPKGAFRMAAGNRDTDGGVTFPLATPLRDRMTHVTMKADLEDWVNNYAIKNRIHPRVVAYLKSADQHFNTLNPNDPSQAGGTSPRSWSRVSDFEYYHDKVGNLAREIFKATVCGRIGDTIGGSYVTYTESVTNLPATMDILDGKVLTIEKLDISQNYFISLNLVYKIIDLYQMKDSKELAMDKWAKYATNFLVFLETNFGKTSQELIILSIKTLTEAGCFLRAKEVPAYKTFVAKYADLVIKSRSL